MPVLRLAARTHPGWVRENNEDAYLAELLPGDEGWLVAVADGMGGHRAGEVASWLALRTLREQVVAGAPLAEAVLAANQEVFRRQAGDPDLSGMGTTLTAAVIGRGGAVELCHVGDSRAYLLRQGCLSRLTRDHSLVEEFVRSGALTEQEARRHPQRNLLTRAIGTDVAVPVDETTVQLQPSDLLLLCSDGLSEAVPDARLADLLAAAGPADLAARVDALIEAALAAGGADNITAVLACWDGEAP
ncbi:protein serine/threonine phosphatase [Thermaerobacter marianensis DSM 12885]|uniref:Protein serine/threonine phosphatase n=1 Tax=Thermaerobacter marianensis (strain ATCC 700841 / DSM 12885 / JCM 10246 / 7p75a) TaxID=644966 RepID=E6SJA8_THEM7|nr:Stp1/IreP family PP2C-type Ser/Thr phosphatase [Thermaerobacter marianensis]ADU51036.1 protein serine/threonine phosphatase [Thermaerobacter marianensis DSM 12885]